MGRPTKTDDPRRSLLTAARGLLLRHGYEHLSLRQVAARAGFSPASVYQYFDGKEQLMGALAAQAAATLTAGLFEASRRATTPAEALVELGLGYIRFATEHPEDFMLLFTRRPSARRHLGQPVEEDSAYAVLASAVRLALLASDRAADAATVEQWAYGLWATAHGLAMLQSTHLKGFRADFAAADRAVLAALIQGWLVRTGPKEPLS